MGGWVGGWSETNLLQICIQGFRLDCRFLKRKVQFPEYICVVDSSFGVLVLVLESSRLWPMAARVKSRFA